MTLLPSKLQHRCLSFGSLCSVGWWLPTGTFQPSSRLRLRRPHLAQCPATVHAPAAVQPHVPTTQPGPVVLILIGSEVLDDGRFPGLQRVGILVRAVSGTQDGEGTGEGTRELTPFWAVSSSLLTTPGRLC